MISNACSALVVQWTSPRLPSSSTSRVPTTSSSSTRRMRARRHLRHVAQSSLKGLLDAIMASSCRSSRPTSRLAGDPLGDRIRGRAWTYDSRRDRDRAGARVPGDLDGAGAILDRLQELQRPDGALDGSYDLAGGDPAGPAAVRQPGLGRPRRARVARGDLLGAPRPADRAASPAGCSHHRAERPAAWSAAAPTSRGSRRSTTSRRARFFAGLGVDDAVARIDRAIDGELFVRRPPSARASATTPGRSTCRRSASSGCSGAAAAPTRRRSSGRPTRRCASTAAASSGRARPGRPSAATARSPTVGPGRAVDGGHADDAPGQGAPRLRRRRARRQRRPLGGADRSRAAAAGRPRRAATTTTCGRRRRPRRG